MKPRSLLLCLLFTVATAPLFADTPHNAVTDWAALVQPAIHSAAAPRRGHAQVLHTMAVLAMYNAVVAIEGGYEPSGAHIRPQPGADVRAAVATAAYLTEVGVAAATGILDLRANDGFANAVLYQCRTVARPRRVRARRPAVPPTRALRSQWMQLLARSRLSHSAIQAGSGPMDPAR